MNAQFCPFSTQPSLVNSWVTERKLNTFLSM